ncbi:MAG: sulfotransferase [Rubrobacteraceae bacterium]|nr:sulfotransferase [Rubrobacteraceae bacterium]
MGKHLGAARLPVVSLREEALVQAAVKETGLTDFGDSYYRESLLRLLESADNDAALHLSGQVALREVIVGSLINRLLLTEACKQTPETFRKPLKSPIIVLGLPRSGTTFLHRLLAMDPAHRAVPWWELARPLPDADSDKQSDRRRQVFQKKLDRRQKLAPDFDRKHYTRVDTPEECIWLLANTFLSPLFWAFAPVYGYLDWYKNQDRLQAYYEYRLLLQVLQGADPTRRLALKSSTHTGAVETLLQTVPGALLIQTHRNPVETSASLVSLFYSVHSRMTERLDVRRMTEAILSFHEHQIARNLAARDAHPGALFDVYYDRLVADPIGTVRDIYDHYDLAWSEEFAERLNYYLQLNPNGKHGAHRYAPETFGQTGEAISERFAAYIERFELTSPNGIQ